MHFNWNSDYLNLDIRGILWALSLYSNGLPLDNALVSPVNLDLKGFPPLLIQAGDAEVLLNDAEHLFRSAVRAGIPAELDIYEDMFHVFQCFSYISEAKHSMARIGEFIKDIMANKQVGEEVASRISKQNGLLLEKIEVINNSKKHHQDTPPMKWSDFSLESFI